MPGSHWETSEVSRQIVGQTHSVGLASVQLWVHASLLASGSRILPETRRVCAADNQPATNRLTYETQETTQYNELYLNIILL